MDKREAIEDWAVKLESLMDSTRASCSAFVTHLILQTRAQSSASRLQSHQNMLAAFDDFLIHLGGVGKLLTPAKAAFSDYKLSPDFPAEKRKRT